MADLALLEELDGFSGLRNGLKRVAAGLGEWAGIPMPLEHAPLVIEPSYPNAEALMAISREEPPTESDITVRNSFWSRTRQSTIVVYNEKESGKLGWVALYGGHHIGMDITTLMASDAWGIEQDANAVRLLGTLVKHHQFKQYMMTGMLLERSKRSGTYYLFRRLKPTVALTANKGDQLCVLCAMCLHPIAYYDGSWAGGMCPTDDVVAHLMLMRGDEKMFWRRANQHPPHSPSAGL